MSTVRASALHVLVALGFGTVIVASFPPINLAAFAGWAIFVLEWARYRDRARGRRSALAVLVIQVASMGVLVTAAVLAPGKTIDHKMARRVALPERAMTIAELQMLEMSWPLRPFRCSLESPDDLYGRVVRFPSRDLSFGEFVVAIEAQTPLRLEFSHCGTCSTIRWGADCGTERWIRETDRKGHR